MPIENALVASARRSTPSDGDLMGGLYFLSLDITPRCNLECVHCYADSHPRRALTELLQPADWLNMLREARTLGCRAVQFAGGEPTIHPAFMSLVREAYRLQFDVIEVYTNGTLLNAGALKELSEMGVSLAVSLYGPDAATHDAVTLRRGSFGKTVNFISTARSLGISVRAGVIETEANEGAGPATVAFARSLGASADDADRTRAFGRGRKAQTEGDSYDGLCGGCWRGSLTVHSSGAISPCSMATFCTVGQSADGLAAALNSRSLIAFREQVSATDKRGGSCKPNKTSCYPYCNKLCKPF